MGLKDLFRGIKDPVRGTAQVVSASMYRGDGILQNCSINLVVQAEGVPATAVQYQGLVNRSRWPVPGMILPVTVDRADPQRVKIEWDEVPSSADLSRQSAESLAAMMRGEGGAAAAGGIAAGVSPTVVNLSGRDLSQLSDEQKTKLRMLGIDPDALAAAQGAGQGPIGGAQSPAAETVGATGEGDGEEMDERLARLERLAKLREQGILDDAEFEAQKKQILEG